MFNSFTHFYPQGIVIFLMSALFPVVALAANPTVSSYAPVENSNGNSRETNLVLTFDQTVIASGGTLAGSATITLYRNDGSVIEVIGASSGAVSVSTTTVTINPQAVLDKNTTYYVFIANDAFENAAGEQYAGISSSDTWFFRTIGGGAGSAARKAREALLSDMPTHYDVEAPSLKDVGIFVPNAQSSSASSASSSEFPDKSAAPEEKRSVAESVVKALAERAAKLLKPSANSLASVAQKFESPLHERACTRVAKRFSGNQKMIDRVNERLQKRFGFMCEL